MGCAARVAGGQAYEAESAAAAFEVAYGASKSARGKARAAPKAPPPSTPPRGADTDVRLMANYLMARFNISSLVQSCGIQWQVFADKYGANHEKTLMVRVRPPWMTASAPLRGWRCRLMVGLPTSARLTLPSA